VLAEALSPPYVPPDVASIDQEVVGSLGPHIRRVRPDSLGLGIMRERIEAIGAMPRIGSRPGRRTTVTVVCPRE
jgi:signal transduction histidine kinase